MKILKYLTYSLALMLLLASCDKHEMKFVDNKVVTDMAEFQLHDFEPIANTAANYIDSVFVNGVLYSSVNGSGQLLPYNGVPGGGVGKFFTVEPGQVNFKFYRKGNIVYDQNVNLTKGKQNVIVHVKSTFAEVRLGRGIIEDHVYMKNSTVSIKGEFIVRTLPDLSVVESSVVDGRTVFETGNIEGYKAFSLEKKYV